MNTTAMLSLKELQFAYQPGVTVLRGVSFDVQAGSVSAILGPNGAGKTTLLRLVLGLLRPGSGSIILNGLPIREYTRREISRWIALVPQRESVLFDYSVLEFVTLGRAPYLGALEQPGTADIKIARQAIEQLDISHLAARAIPELSGGELQLVLVARALAQQTKILLMDEPTSHLDLSNKFRVLDIMRLLANEDKTILFTTHDPEAASATADGLVLVRDGQVLDAGPMDAVFTGEKLSQTYGVLVDVLKVDGQKIVVQQGHAHP